MGDEKFIENFRSMTENKELRKISEGSQSHQRVKYGQESRGTRNQGSLCWRGPAVSPKERHYLEGPALNGRIILKWIIKK
jgi:hypothetical protein